MNSILISIRIDIACKLHALWKIANENETGSNKNRKAFTSALDCDDFRSPV